MGQLARIGIVGGKRVPIELFSERQRNARVESFGRQALLKSGYGDIARKITKREKLSNSEVERLLVDASFPVLLKLIEIAGLRCITPRAVPAMVIPFSSWIREMGAAMACERAIKVVRRVPYETLEVAFDFLDLARFTSDIVDTVRQLSASRNGLSLVGPAIEEIMACVRGPSFRDHGSDEHEDLFRLLDQLRSAGFSRLRSSTSRHAIKLVAQHGFPVSLMTDISIFPSAQLLAEEFLRLRALCEDGISVDVWSPASGREEVAPGVDQTPTELRLLRTLAVGALVLSDIQHRRVSSRYFSVDGMQFASLLGADDLGFGALDEATEHVLHLKPFGVVQKIRTVGIVDSLHE